MKSTKVLNSRNKNSKIRSKNYRKSLKRSKKRLVLLIKRVVYRLRSLLARAIISKTRLSKLSQVCQRGLKNQKQKFEIQNQDLKKQKMIQFSHKINYLNRDPSFHGASQCLQEEKNTLTLQILKNHRDTLKFLENLMPYQRYKLN